MPGIKVLIKGLNKVIDFPANTAMPDIEKHIKGNWSSVEEMSGLPMDTASRMERAKHLGFSLPTVAAAGGLAMLAPEDVEASFLGQGAKKAALDMLGMAKKMEGSKVSPDEIWQKTGWGKGADDKWRFEVDDSQIELDIDAAKMSEHGFKTAKADELLKGENISSSYPGLLEKTTVSFNPRLEAQGQLRTMRGSELLGTDDFHSLQVKDSASKGRTKAEKIASYQKHIDEASKPEEIDRIMKQYDLSREDAIKQKDEDIADLKEFIGEAQDDPFFLQDTKSTITHEGQHIIQGEEGFARGGSSDEFAPSQIDPGEINALRILTNREANETGKKFGEITGDGDAVKKFKGMFGREPTMTERILASNIQEEINETGVDVFSTKAFKDAALTPHEKYMRLAGEVEARNVQTRLDMTPEQRRATPPWKTEDRLRGEQVVKYDSRGGDQLAKLGGTGAAALASVSPVQAGAHKNFMAELSGANLPSATAINAPFIDQSNIPTQFRPGLGGIQSPISPSFINQAGGKLKRLEFPVIGNPLEGVSDYLENFGYEDSSAERLKRAAMAGLDII